ncbi:hypothetical protein T492DRAFT_152415 [Pavlovales sp. CCMP2436]|nr:hypothetical protein T492DRAFT_152415 [Pavlovales sp. CCMP2436]
MGRMRRRRMRARGCYCATTPRLLRLQRRAAAQAEARDAEQSTRRERKNAAAQTRKGAATAGGTNVESVAARLNGAPTGDLKWPPTSDTAASAADAPTPSRAKQESTTQRKGEPLPLRGATGTEPPAGLTEEASNAWLPRPHAAFEALLKPHQREALQFVWRAVLSEEQGQGAVLAHSMGLGKTLTTISLIHTLLASPRSPRLPNARPPPPPSPVPLPGEPPLLPVPAKDAMCRRIIVACPVVS